MTLKNLPRPRASGLTTCAILEAFASCCCPDRGRSGGDNTYRGIERELGMA